jgi:pimeloyl-ACP methyl ester carboxylesterase
VKEEALLLGAHRSLVGVYTPAASSATRCDGGLAVVLLNAGLIHHVGPHRLHVKLARALAEHGLSALRVDLSAIGDSSVRPDSLPSKDLAVREPKEIMDDLGCRGHGRFVLFGICSGASLALQSASADPRVVGVVLINPAFATEDRASLALGQHYLTVSARNPRAWLNLFTGQVKYSRLLRTLLHEAWRKVAGRNRELASVTDVVRAELAPILVRDTQLLIFLSGRHAARYERFIGDEVLNLQASGRLQMEVHPESDHLFTCLSDQDALVTRICRWVESIQSATPNIAVPLRTSLQG